MKTQVPETAGWVAETVVGLVSEKGVWGRIKVLLIYFLSTHFYSSYKKKKFIYLALTVWQTLF